MEDNKIFKALEILSQRKRKLKISRGESYENECKTTDPGELVEIRDLNLILTAKILEINEIAADLENIFYKEEAVNEKG